MDNRKIRKSQTPLQYKAAQVYTVLHCVDSISVASNSNSRVKTQGNHSYFKHVKRQQTIMCIPVS